MAKMTQAQMKEAAKAQVQEAIQAILDASNGEAVGGFETAIPVTVNEQEIWVEVKLTAKNWYDTKTTKAYDPFEKQREYHDTLADREARAKAAADKKAKKIAKSAKATEATESAE